MLAPDHSRSALSVEIDAMMRTYKGLAIGLIVWIGAGLAACGDVAGLDLEGVGVAAGADQELYGRVNYASNCSQEERGFLDDTMFYGRTAAASDAFEQCVTQTMTAGYEGCAGDPFNSSALAGPARGTTPPCVWLTSMEMGVTTFAVGATTVSTVRCHAR